MSHVTVPSSFTSPISTSPLNGDGIGYVASYDFSTANLSHENRIAAISTIASICYANPNALGSIKLYDRLATESHGLPSSSFEFVPVLLSAKYVQRNMIVACKKYGEWVEGYSYLLTNLRALISDIGENASTFFNTPEECTIIAKHFKVFKSKIDLSTRSQLVRHRASFQELSRRYVSDKREPFEFYISPKMRQFPETDHIIDASMLLYHEALASGVKPEEARRLLPQAAYTTIWSAWLPSQFLNLVDLRCTPHAQSEIRDLVSAMQDI